MRIADLQPGWRTDLILHGFDGQVAERPDCLVVRTPSCPTYYWGNCLELPAAPADADLPHWLARFDEEIGRWQPESRHVAIGIYRSLGYQPVSADWGLQRRAPQDRRA